MSDILTNIITNPEQIAWNDEFINYFNYINDPTHIPSNLVNSNLRNVYSTTVPPFYIQRNILGYPIIVGSASTNSSGLSLSSGATLLSLASLITPGEYMDTYFASCINDDMYSFYYQSSTSTLFILPGPDQGGNAPLSIYCPLYPVNFSNPTVPISFRIFREGFMTRNADFGEWLSQFQITFIGNLLNTDYFSPTSPVYFFNGPNGYCNIFGWGNLTADLDTTEGPVGVLDTSSFYNNSALISNQVQVNFQGNTNTPMTLMYSSGEIIQTEGQVASASTSLTMNFVLF